MRRFDTLLTDLNDRLLAMGGLVENAIIQAAQSLITQDVALAKQVIEDAGQVGQAEKDIQALCLKLLLQQQPVARDLRLISSALKMITDMERIGDQAADISEIVVMMNGAPYVTKLEHIPQMATATVKMVTESLDAFVRNDLQLARDVVDYDDVVDDLFDRVKFDLIDLIKAGNPNAEQAIDLLMIAKFFERIGDHAVNIARWVAFSITGQQVD